MIYSRSQERRLKMAKELHLGKMSMMELADWFGKNPATLSRQKTEYLSKLEKYCDFEELPSGKINITAIHTSAFSGSGNKQIIKNNFCKEWNDNGLDTAKNVAEKIMDNNELNISDGTAYVYTLQARNELYNKPFCGRGEKGCCEYVWCVELGGGQYRELTPQEQEVKTELLKKYFGDASEKQLMVEAMVKAGEITEAEAFSVLKQMTGMNNAGFYGFLKELNKRLNCKVIKATKLINSAW
jgi:hypothetical protein